MYLRVRLARWLSSLTFTQPRPCPDCIAAHPASRKGVLN